MVYRMCQSIAFFFLPYCSKNICLVCMCVFCNQCGYKRTCPDNHILAVFSWCRIDLYHISCSSLILIFDIFELLWLQQLYCTAPCKSYAGWIYFTCTVAKTVAINGVLIIEKYENHCVYFYIDQKIPI